MVFNIRVLPLVKLGSALIVHSFFLMFTIILYACYGRRPDLFYLQLLYYGFCAFFLTLGLTYTTAAVVVFFRDLQQVIAIGLQVGVWLTPIMWVADASLATKPLIHAILRLNPMYYIVSGYRDCFFGKCWFWEKPIWTAYFWIFSFACFCFGCWVFERLKAHFADVL